MLQSASSFPDDREAIDCGLDWAAWVGAYYTGDLTFSDDDGIVNLALLVSTVVSSGFFILEMIAYCCFAFEQCPKFTLFLEAFQLGFEDLSQATFYMLATEANYWKVIMALDL